MFVPIVSRFSGVLCLATLCVLMACSDDKARRTADSIRLAAHFDSMAADSVPPPLPPPSPPATIPPQRSQPAPAASSGWVSGDAATAEMRRVQEERQRRLAEQQGSSYNRPAPRRTPSESTEAQKRRAAGLASYADCIRAKENVQKIKDARRYAGKLYQLNINGRGFEQVDSAEASRMLVGQELFLAEKCGR